MQTIKLGMKELIPIMNEYFACEKEFRLFIKGTSMLPTLREGVDSVLLYKPDNPSKLDIVLYRRTNGQLVLHRIIGQNKYGYIICGDNHLQKESKIARNQILAKAMGIFQGDTFIASNDKQYLSEIKKMYRYKKYKRLRAIAAAAVRKIFSNRGGSLKGTGL